MKRWKDDSETDYGEMTETERQRDDGEVERLESMRGDGETAER